MAEYQGKNAAVANGVNGANKVPQGEHVGRVRCLYDEVDLSNTASGVNNGAGLAGADTVKIGPKLQAGARVLNIVLSAGSVAAGTYDIGWTATATDVVDADGFGAGQVAAIYGKAETPAGSPGLGKKFESATQITLTATGAVAAAANKLAKVWVYYVLD